MSPCSSSCACGMISLSTKLLTVDRISRWMSVRSAVCAKRVNGRSFGTALSVVTRQYGPPDRVPGVCSVTPGGGPSRAPEAGSPQIVVEYPLIGDRWTPEGPMSTSDENLYRGDPPASPPPGFGPPPGYGPPGPPGPPPAYGQP